MSRNRSSSKRPRSPSLANKFPSSENSLLECTAVSVCRTSDAIGYLPTSSAYFKQKNKFKEIKVKKSKDSPVLDAQQPDFPISMPCYLFWNAKASDSCISQFVNLCTETMRK